jgi:hypothetical protein
MNNGMRAALLAAIALATLLLGTCSDTNLVALLTNEVKRANNKFLVVQSVDPTNSSINVNPGMRMSVKVDRILDMTTVGSSTVTVTDLTGTDPTVFQLVFSFNDVTKTLYLDSDPWLADQTDYVLTITKGVKGSDGSELENEYTWSFRTGTYPKGNVKIEADRSATNKASPAKLSLNIVCNKTLGIVYRLGQTEAECLASGAWYPVGGTVFPDSTNFGFASGSLDGPQSAYIQFKDEGSSEYSAVRYDTIILDTVLPVITVYSLTIYQNLTTTPTPSISGSDDRSGVDTTTFLWANGGNPVTFTPANVQAPSVAVTGSEKVPYPVTVTVKDLAGNTSAPATVNVYKDTIPPDGAPVVAATTPSPAFTPAPRWSWTATSTAGTGEAPPQFKYEIRNSANELFYTLSSTALSYNTRPAIKWPDYSRGAPPDTYTIYVWERDLAGNTSTTAGTSAVVVTSVLPVDRAKNVSLTPTLQWWTMAGPKDPSQAPKYYVLHYGYLDKAGRLIEYRPIEVGQPDKTDPSQLLPILELGMTYLWYVEVPDFGLRSPAAKDQYWSFTTTTKG